MITHQLQSTGFWIFCNIFPHIAVWHPLGYHGKGNRGLRNPKEWNDIGMWDAFPHRNLLAKDLVVKVSHRRHWEAKGAVTNYLPDCLDVLVLAYTETFNRNSLAVASALPNIAESSMGNWAFICLDGLIGYCIRTRE